MKIAILGGGIHGVSIAYYLAKNYNQKSVIIEQTSIAAAASGKSGGFLAREWGSGPTIQLHHVSYDYHKELARDLDIESFREISTLSVDGSKKGKNNASWLDRNSSSNLMDTGTAQVTPLELVNKMLEFCLLKGCEVIIDKVIGVNFPNGKVESINLEKNGTQLFDKVVLCLGPWSGVAVEDWFGIPLPMEGVKSTSIVFNNIDEILKEAYACFCEEDENGCHIELYPRHNGDLYVCGCGGSDHVQGDRLRKGGDCENAESILADENRVNSALKSLRSITSICDRTPSIKQACMRPCTDDALPVMGNISDIEGAYISAGHNCWGILWAPACGVAMSELIIEGISKTIDLSPFDLARYNKISRARGRKKVFTPIGEQW